MNRWSRPAHRAVLGGGVAMMTTALVLASPSPANAAPDQAGGPGWELTAMSVGAAHEITQGEGVTVAVLDSGIRTDHPALEGRAEEGTDMLGENDRDQPYYGNHGTAMASSVLDVAPQAKVLGIRITRDDDDPDFSPDAFASGPDPVTGTALLRGIQQAVAAGAGVISMSVGDGQTVLSGYDADTQNAIAEANARGIVVIASAGNEAKDLNGISYPAAFAGVIAVGAGTPGGRRADFSQVHDYVDVLAPGVDINAADINGGRSPGKGTSPAAALTAGAAALIRSAYPGLSAGQVEKALETTASHYSAGHDPETGYGQIDAAAALNAASGMTPGEMIPAATIYTGPEHFGPGDDGTPRATHVPFDWEYVAIAMVGIVPGALMILFGIRLFRGSRARRRAMT
ncbi:type VII secretion-associated serine protease mycosin [Pseudonocardia aurantiaca]|uniref:S8 family serine peptidase n=1 Tax=Pseudonocardia aurantiaca TaxID=75290 RepID=A0ABW4FRX7_9PSEU